MINEEQEKFITFWAEHRDEYNKSWSKLVRGLPMALMFGLPILLLLFVVYLFIPDWYYKISKTSSQAFVVVIIAVSIAVVFYAFVRMHFKWEMNEQLYKELKQKQRINNLNSL